MYKDSMMKREAQRLRKSYYFITFLALLVITITFNLSHYIIMKKQNDEAIARLEETVTKLTLSRLEEEVKTVFQYIDYERAYFKNEQNLYEADKQAAEKLDEAIKPKLVQYINSLKLIDDGYFWIHEISRNQNQEVYIKRIAHGFLDNEQMFKLDSIADEDGFPFKEEYLSISKTGEAFLEYYFPKPNDALPYPKLAYSKLYEDFSWIIGTGVYLDDIELVIKEEENIASFITRNQLSADVIGFLLIIIVIILFVLFIDKAMQKIINDSYKRILLAETALKEEKRKVDEAYALMKELADHDELTGLKNRRSGLERLSLEAARARRANSTFCVALGDIDHFKNINDGYGHETGDLLLIKVARTLEAGIRVEDMALRWGGEEFLLLLSDSTLAEALEVAERLREAISKQNIIFNGETLSVTITIGVAEYHPGERITDLVSRADKAMYKGKALGRNRVIASTKPQ